MNVSEARHAFITGGASGIGLGIAEALAARGVQVTIADANEETLAAVLVSHGDGWRGVVLDVRDRAGWARAKAEAEAAFGPVDIVVNNAGIAPNGQTFADMNPDSFDRIIAINLTGVFNGVHTFAADMRDRGRGHVVNTASMAGLATSVAGTGAYSAAKFGVVSISETLRGELAENGVGVSVLCPGYVQTGLSLNTARLGGETRGGGLAMPPSDISPEQVGDMVVRGIEANDLYIISHPHNWSGVEKRIRGLLAAFGQDL
ncbi:MAG: SDR family NAD(P)-dependent oxidoreductase [Sphingomonadales bacterium]|nr:SDR family NAD(P)-dependent oxidoreductase [Sphingomonadales bacterium]